MCSRPCLYGGVQILSVRSSSGPLLSAWTAHARAAALAWRCSAETAASQSCSRPRVHRLRFLALPPRRYSHGVQVVSSSCIHCFSWTGSTVWNCSKTVTRWNRPDGFQRFGSTVPVVWDQTVNRVSSMCIRKGVVLPERHKPENTNQNVARMRVRGPLT
jgi:hypothetical protein